MGDRPYISFAEVKQKVSLPDVLDTLGIANQFSRKGDSLTGACPLPCHQHGPRPNKEQFKINVKDGISVFHCFGDCQRGGDVIEFVKAMTGYDNAHVRFWFAEHFGDRLSLRKPKRSSASSKNAAGGSADRDEEAPSGSEPASADTSAAREPLQPLRFFLNLDPDVPYLRERGLTPETIRRYGLGLCQRGTLNGYVAIPVYSWPREPGANPVGHVGRWPAELDGYPEDRPRYKVPGGFETSRVVYGLSEALERSKEGTPLIVVEGPFKLFHLVQAGFSSAVSTFTASISEEQAEILASTGRPVVILFDGNHAGREGARRAAGRLITKSFVRVAKLPDKAEPDDLSAEELRDLLSFI